MPATKIDRKNTKSTVRAARTALVWVAGGALASMAAWSCMAPTGESDSDSQTEIEDPAEDEEIGSDEQAICLIGPAFPSCYGQCGTITCSPAYPQICCACDDGCDERGDCCCDVETYCPAPVVPSCEGHCGEMSPDGCWCDVRCSGLGDCCEDFESTCDDPIQIAVGFRHACALSATGGVRCWGNASSGQLGYGNSTTIGDNETPASAGDVPLGGIATQIKAGRYHTCAILTTGAVRCWGYNQFGQLGYGHTNRIGDDETPASVGNVNVGGTVTQLALGRYHTCALLSTGAVRCWGSAADGRLGYGNEVAIGDNEAPATAGNVNVGGTVTQIATGEYHTCALLSSGAVRCWGTGDLGALGYGGTASVGDNETPASAGSVTVGGAVTQITTGSFHTCARLATGSARCWGLNFDGQLGYGHTQFIGDNETPMSAGNVNVGGSVAKLVGGYEHTCAILSTGDVRCWGRNAGGTLGYGHSSTIGDNETPASAGSINLGGSAAEISAGGSTCALLTTGPLRCWGSNGYGQLGYGHTYAIGDNEAPASAGNVPVY